VYTNKNIKNEKNEKEEERTSYAYDAFSTFKKYGFYMAPGVVEEINNLVEEYSTEWVIEAIKRSSDRGKKTLGYIKGILNNWKIAGAIDDPKKKEFKKSESSGNPFIDILKNLKEQEARNESNRNSGAFSEDCWSLSEPD